MYSIDFNAGNNEYKLRLNTKNIVALEKTLGCNPLGIFNSAKDGIPTVSVMVAVLHASLQQLNHGISMDKAYDIFDSWIEDGHTSIEFIQVILDIYRASGIMPSETEEKN